LKHCLSAAYAVGVLVCVASIGACGASANDGSGSDEAASSAASKRKCDALTTRILAAPITPPSEYGTFDLATGRDPRGLTINEADAARCATVVGGLPAADEGGERAVRWGGESGLTAWYNLESRVISSVELGPSYTGSVKFHSRDGGTFGVHTYEISTRAILRDGQSFAVDWNSDSWAGELDDALLATFKPDSPAVTSAGCHVTGQCLYLPDDGNGTAIFGPRPIHFYVKFKAGTGQVTGLYNVWQGGRPDCTTPKATLEEMDYASVSPGFVSPGHQVGPWVGSLDLTVSTRKPGLTWQDANALECNGKSVPSPDPGYGAIAWGGGEVLLEFNATTNFAYKVIVKAGYNGPLVAADGKNTFSFTIGGSVTKNGAPFALDWANPSSFTELSNAIGINEDTDCVAAQSCVVTADDGAGHSVAAFPRGGVEIAFAKGTSTPVSFTAVSQKGK
jgi:hypothetical protein